jgi:hypothetical protein
MLVGPTRASFLVVVAAVSVGAVIACNGASNPASGVSTYGGSNSSSAESTSSADAQPPCPTSFAEVATATCSVEGQSCTFLVPCTTFPANAICVCTGGSFTCSGFGDAGTACPAAATTEKCPGTEMAANGLFCSDLGLICTYASACTGIPEYDSCQCVGGRTATEQAHFECTMPCIPVGDGAAPNLEDASAPDANAAPADGAPSIDGASDL